MSDSEQDRPLVIWGMPVPRKQNGRYMWPPEIKAMAAERVAAGVTVAAIAREIPANESVIGKWVRGRRGDSRAQNCQAGLVEVVAVIDGEDPGAAAAVRRTPASHPPCRSSPPGSAAPGRPCSTLDVAAEI